MTCASSTLSFMQYDQHHIFNQIIRVISICCSGLFEAPVCYLLIQKKPFGPPWTLWESLLYMYSGGNKSHVFLAVHAWWRPNVWKKAPFLNNTPASVTPEVSQRSVTFRKNSYCAAAPQLPPKLIFIVIPCWLPWRQTLCLFYCHMLPPKFAHAPHLPTSHLALLYMSFRVTVKPNYNELMEIKKQS